MARRWFRFAPMVLVFAAGCILPQEGPYAPAQEKPRPLAEQVRRTQTLTVLLDGKPVGYLMTLLDKPKTEGDMPKDTRFIQDLDFRNVGFITPLGKTFRYEAEGRTTEVCQRSLERDLAWFFGRPEAKVTLEPLAGR